MPGNRNSAGTQDFFGDARRLASPGTPNNVHMSMFPLSDSDQRKLKEFSDLHAPKTRHENNRERGLELQLSPRATQA
jgi:hypothetical protein